MSSSSREPPARRLSAALAGAGLVACMLLVHFPFLIGRVPYLRDAHLANVPVHVQFAELLHRGEFPEWWPWDAGGAPVLSVPPAELLHPSVLLYALLPPLTALAWHGALATLLALAGAYALARALGQPRASAFVAAVVFGVNGYVTCLVEQTFMLVSAATMPWYALSLLLAARRGGSWLAAPAASFALQILAGDPQAAILSAFFGAAVVLAERRDRRAVLLAVASPLMAGALAAAQILPALELVPATQRSMPRAAEQWALDRAHLLQFLLPLPRGMGFVASTGLGLPIVALVAASAVAWRRRPLWAVLVVTAILGLWLALGESYGLTNLARLVVPMWAKFRYPVKSVVLAMLAISLLAGEGLRQLAGPRRRQARLVALTAATAGFVVMLVFAEERPAKELVALVAVTVLLLVVVPRRRGAAIAACATAGILLLFSLPRVHSTGADFYDEPPLAGVLRGAGVGLDGSAFDRLDDRRDAGWYQPVLDMKGVGGKGSLAGAMWGLPSLSPYSLSASGRLCTFFVHARDRFHDPAVGSISVERARMIYGLYGAEFLVLHDTLVKPDDRVVGADPQEGLVAVRQSGALPRAFAVPCARGVSTAAEAEDVVLSPDFTASREVVVEGLPPGPCAAAGTAAALTVSHPSNRAVTLAGEAPFDGWWVLNEAWFPGWTATLDGREVPIETGNVAMRAVAVPAGRHTLNMEFRTPGLVRGALLSAMAWIGLVLFAWRMRRARSGFPRPVASVP